MYPGSVYVDRIQNINDPLSKNTIRIIQKYDPDTGNVKKNRTKAEKSINPIN